MPAGKFRRRRQPRDDGRWIAEVVALPGVLTYGSSREEALAKAEVLPLRVLADRLEHGKRFREPAAINATLTGIATDIPREAGEEVVVLLHHPAVIAGAGVPSRGEAGAGVEPLGLELFDTKRPIGTSMSVIAVC